MGEGVQEWLSPFPIKAEIAGRPQQVLSRPRCAQTNGATIRRMRIAAALLCSFLLLPALRAAQTLEVYVIDVEGGKSVLLVTPSGESMLFDAGWPGSNGRDVNRIVDHRRRYRC